MESTDTIKLLKECDAGTKMAVSSIDDVLNQVNDVHLKTLLTESKVNHTKTGNEIHRLLLAADSEDKEPAAIAKGMSWMKTNMKLAMDDSDRTVADLITDGCNMGIKSLYRYLNQYKAADEESKGLCQELIALEETLRHELRCYL